MNKKYPYPIFIYPTLHCNFSCSYCFTFSGPAEPESSFLLRRWEEFVRACSVLGIPEVRLSGGEPLLISDIQERCKSIIECGMRYTILTNGSLLGRHLGWLAKEPPETIWISYHREYTSPDTFERYIASAASVLPRVGVHLFSCDVEDNPMLVERVVKAGSKRIKILSLTPIGRCAQATKTGVWTLDFVEEQLARWQDLGNGPLEVRVEAPVFGDTATGEGTCVLRERQLLSVDHNGLVYPCCVTVGTASTAIGNLKTETLGAIVDRVNSPSRQLPCSQLLPLISLNKSCCPLRLVTLSAPV